MSAHWRRVFILLNKSTKMIIVSKDSKSISNICGWPVKSIVNDFNIRRVGRLAGLASSESASTAQLRKRERMRSDHLSMSHCLAIVADNSIFQLFFLFFPQDSSLTEISGGTHAGYTHRMVFGDRR